MNLLYRAATDNARATDDRREAVRKLKEEFSGYFKNLSDEQIMLGQANDTYKELIKNIYKYAKHRRLSRAWWISNSRGNSSITHRISKNSGEFMANTSRPKRNLLKNRKPTLRHDGDSNILGPKRRESFIGRETKFRSQKRD